MLRPASVACLACRLYKAHWQLENPVWSLLFDRNWTRKETRKPTHKHNLSRFHSNTLKMKAISPVRSFRKNNANLTEHSLGISRSKTPVDDPLSLLYNMNDCYSKLKELVPSIPQNKNVSKMEILQHVIDYILDLQIALDSSVALTSLHHQPSRPGQAPSRTPLTTLNTDISILSLQVITS